MSCNLPASLASALVEFWLLTHTPGPVITGSAVVVPGGEEDAPDNIDLVLGRTDRSTGAALPVVNGWTVEPVGTPAKPCFNGSGTAVMPAGSLSLASVGDGVTLAVRAWTGAGQIQGAPAGPVAKPLQLLGLAGQYDANPTKESGLSVLCPDPTAGTPGLTARQWNGVSATEQLVSGSSVPSNPFLLVVTVERIAGGLVRVTCYVDGTQAGPAVTGPAALVALSRFTAGDTIESDGGFSEAAIWARLLSGSEISALGETLECLPSLPPSGGGGSGSADPLLEPDGTSALHPEWIVPRTDAAGVIAAGGEQRHTRRVHECVPREYELRVRLGSGREVDLVREAIAVTRGGAFSTRWRHPQDDPAGPVGTAPRWLILNADEASGFIVDRSKGGHLGTFALRLREVV